MGNEKELWVMRKDRLLYLRELILEDSTPPPPHQAVNSHEVGLGMEGFQTHT